MLISLFQSPVIFTYKGPVSKNVSKQTEHENASLKSTDLCSCTKGLSVTITTAIQTYGIWPLPRNFCVYAEFREIPRKHGNSAATAKFRGRRKTVGPIHRILLFLFSVLPCQQLNRQFLFCIVCYKYLV